MPVSLFQQLIGHPSAPSREHGKFVVGGLREQRLRLQRLVHDMAQGDEVSRLQLIRGPNGNGKTLLNRAVMQKATEINEVGLRELAKVTFDKTFDPEHSPFKVLYSHVVARSNKYLAATLSSGLSCTIDEPSEVTYTRMLAWMYMKKRKGFRPPWHLRMLPSLGKGAVNQLKRMKEEWIPDLLDENKTEVARATEYALSALSKAMVGRWERREFTRLVATEDWGVYLKDVGGDEARSITTASLNRSIHNALKGQPVQSGVGSIKSLARAVGCRLLVLLIDDCAEQSVVKELLPLCEELAEWDDIKLLVVLSGVSENVTAALRGGRGDTTAEDRFRMFGNPIEVAKPTNTDLRELAGKLRTIADEHFAGQEKSVQLTEEEIGELIQGVATSRPSYRRATVDILKAFGASAA